MVGWMFGGVVGDRARIFVVIPDIRVAYQPTSLAPGCEIPSDREPFGPSKN